MLKGMKSMKSMKGLRVAAFAEEGKWTSGADSTMRLGDWQAWVNGDGHWKVRGPDPDNEAHYADGDIELTEAAYIEAGNSEARRKIRARRAKEAARAYIKAMGLPSKRQHSTKKPPAQLQREIDEVLSRTSTPQPLDTWRSSSDIRAATKKDDRLDNFGQIWRVLRVTRNKITVAREVPDPRDPEKAVLVDQRDFHPRDIAHMRHV